MKVNILCKKLIKPCTPTPQNLNRYKISFTDELMPPINLAILLFYPSNPKPISRSHLEESLAKILPQFYPLAGRYIKKNHSVDCSDQGAEFVEAEAPDVELIDLVETTKPEQLNDLLPHQPYPVDEAATDPLLRIQVTELKRGGLVVGVSISHRVADVSSVGTFIAAWSNASNPGEVGEIIKISPTFDIPSLLPGKNLDHGQDPGPPGAEDHKIVVKKFLFNREAIASLRSKLRPNDGKAVSGSSRVISRVRVVCALIAKVLIRLDRAKYGKPRDCVVFQPVNMRERTIPPLPKHSCGNLGLASLSRRVAAAETEDMGIQELVDVIGDGIQKSMADFAQVLSSERDGRSVIIGALQKLGQMSESGEVNVMMFSDWSKFGFYDADFGWGKPLWAGIGPAPCQNMTVLMNNKEDDGIEAWVSLDQCDMHYFERDREIQLLTTN